MSSAPSLAHYCSYPSTASGSNARKTCHASSSISSPDCLGASPRPRCNSSGLGTISYNVSFWYQTMGTSQGGTTTPHNLSALKHGPDHLLVLVHGILASPKDWTYAKAELKKQLGEKFLIYVSSSNTYIKTFSGIDGAGRRLAEEVLCVVQKTKSLKKISFLAHSLGGLFTRYAIAILYSSGSLYSSQHKDAIHSDDENPDKSERISSLGQIAGLEPINFITLATPHLGVRGRKQLPFLLGLAFLEKLVAPLAPMLTGKTGHQLFITDGKPEQPPLLLRMTSDSSDLKFISSLASFKNRVLYANVSYDHMVGWRTSSIRRESELIKVLLFEVHSSFYFFSSENQNMDKLYS
ncbi:hypothetical protein KSP40_PGU017744 [Platanthera guangdongensis]|uniref:DUF676 domain-containing protein n=1 Tax=Platanthera guangdongensis TaxID=2320717 RepID=A0ABR2M1J5_9ASPA